MAAKSTYWLTHQVQGVWIYTGVLLWAGNRLIELIPTERGERFELDGVLFLLAGAPRQVKRHIEKLEGRKRMPSELQQGATRFKKAFEDVGMDRLRSFVEYRADYVSGSSDAKYRDAVPDGLAGGWGISASRDGRRIGISIGVGGEQFELGALCEEGLLLHEQADAYLESAGWES